MTIKQAYLLSWASSIQLKVYTACCFIFWLWRRHGWQALDVPAKDDDGGDCDNNAKDEQLCFKQEVFASKIVLQFSSFSENLMQSLCQMSTLCHCLCCCRLYCLNDFWNGVPIYIDTLFPSHWHTICWVWFGFWWICIGTTALEDTLHFLGNPPFKHGKRISCNLFSFTASQAITLGRLFQEMFFWILP